MDFNTVKRSGLAAIPSSVLHALDAFDPSIPILPMDAPDLPLNIDGSGYPLGGTINTLDPHKIAVGEPVGMTFTVYDVSDIVHFAVYLNLHGSDATISNSDTYIRFNNGHVSVTDPNGFIAGADITVAEDEYRPYKKKVRLDMEFESGMGLTNMVVRIWDEKSRSTIVQILDALEIPATGAAEPEPEPREQEPRKPYTCRDGRGASPARRHGSTLPLSGNV